MAKEVTDLDHTMDSAYVRILRHWSDKEDRIKPEIYKVTGYLLGGPHFILTNLLTNAEVHIPHYAQSGRRIDARYLVINREEATDYLNECMDRAIQDSQFVTRLKTELTEKTGQCQEALRRMVSIDRTA